MLAQSIYVDVQVVLCSIFRSVSPAPGTPNFTGPVKRARPDSVLGTAPPFLQGNNVAELSQMALDVVRPLPDYLTKNARVNTKKINLGIFFVCMHKICTYII